MDIRLKICNVYLHYKISNFLLLHNQTGQNIQLNIFILKKTINGKNNLQCLV